MGIASEVRKLTANIASSRQDRAQRLGQIREEANQASLGAKQLIGGFQTSRRGAGLQLRKDLARDKAQRKSQTKGILKEAQDILRELSTSREQTKVQLRKNLSKGGASRRSQVKEILQNARKLTDGFEASRKKMGSELRQELSRGRSNAKSQVAELLGNAQNLIEGFQRSHREKSNELRKGLAQNRTERESEVKKMRNDISAARANMRAELSDARAAWLELAGIKVAPKAETQEVKERVPEVPVLEEEIPDLEAKLLNAVNKHSEGITLAKVAHSLGVAPVVLGRASKNLIDKGKILKKKRLYFPITGKGGRYAE